ncbi:hypothetical protein D3C80_677270 [compost metagenome]
MFGTRSSFTEQGGEGKTLATGDLESGFGAGAAHVLALADHASLLDDIEVLDGPVTGFDDAVIGCIETQLALFDEKRQVGVLHLVERRKALQKLQGPLDILQNRSLSGLGEGVHFAHEHLPHRGVDLCTSTLLFSTFMVGRGMHSAHWT